MSNVPIRIHFPIGTFRAFGKVADRSEWRIARDVFVAETLELARGLAQAVLVNSYIQHEIPNRQPSLSVASKMDLEMPDSAVDVNYMMENNWIDGDS